MFVLPLDKDRSVFVRMSAISNIPSCVNGEKNVLKVLKESNVNSFFNRRKVTSVNQSYSLVCLHKI